MASKSEGPLLVLWGIENPANRVVVNAQNAFSPSDPRVRAGLLDPKGCQTLRHEARERRIIARCETFH
jgi:hypothetical protein